MAPDVIPGAIAIPADLFEVRLLAQWLKERCAEAGVDEIAAFDLELALVEAANNVVEHGYAGAEGVIGLDFSVADDVATLSLMDRGSPVPDGMFNQCRQVPLDATEGRGVGIVQSCVDTVSYATSDGLNTLTLTKRL